MANNSDTVLSEDINSLSQKQKDVIIGTVLGDGSIYYLQSGANIKYNYANEKYANFVFKSLGDLCINKEIKICKIKEL